MLADSFEVYGGTRRETMPRASFWLVRCGEQLVVGAAGQQLSP